MADAINPAHYKGHPSGVECIQVIYPYLFDQANAVKYLWRLGMKDEDVQELEKAAWYVKHAIMVGYVTPDELLTFDAVMAFTTWYAWEPEGYRRKAIDLILEGRLTEALETIYSWIASIKGIGTWEVSTPDPEIGGQAKQ